MLEHKQVSELGAAQQSRSSISGYSVRDTSNTSKTYHAFMDFKKAFDRVLYEALWAIMRLYNINTNLTRITEQLYNKATSAVYFNGSIGDWFRMTVEVRQGYLLSPTLFNIFLDRIMTDLPTGVLQMTLKA